MWFALMAALVAVAALQLIRDFSVGRLLVLGAVAVVVGLPIRREWIDDRDEVMAFFSRSVTTR